MELANEVDVDVETDTLLASERLLELTSWDVVTATSTDTEEEVFARPAESVNVKQLSKFRLCLITFAMFGMSFYVYLSTVGVLPSQVLALVGSENKGKLLGAVLAAGGVITFLVSPLIGTWSDRLQTRFGKRTPIIFVCSIVMCILLFGLAWSAPTLPGCQTDSCYIVNVSKPLCPGQVNDSSCATGDTENMTLYGAYFVAYAITSGLYAAISVAWNGLIGDMCPDDLRGFVSGLNGMFTLLGYAAGALWNVFYRNIGVWPTYAFMSSIFFVAILVTVIGAREGSSVDNVKRQPLNFKAGIKQYWKPLQNWDFFWVFMTRFFMQMGLYTIVGYIYYFMVDVVSLPKCMSPERATGLLMLPLLVSGGVIGAVAGHWSDRWKRRKPFVITAGVLMAIGSGGFLTWVREFGPGVAVACVVGIGFGLYVTVDFALLLDVLPDKMSRGNDMAVWHQSIVLPQFLAVPIAGVVVDHLQAVGCKYALGYVVLFVITGVYFLLSGVFVSLVRKTR